ncbi:MAG: nucleotidyltransferase family protein [Chitinophagaceae bacterium]|nr:nucleotidyltransferase family protein [Chitinophagaceae bacterium]
MKSKNIAVVLLAAGSSSRLGQPKQDLLFEGDTLFNNALAAAIEATNHVVVVLGSWEPWKEIESSVHVIVNDNWEDGMGSSIAIGMKECQRLMPGIDAVIFMVCDQPYLTADVLNGLIEKFNESSAPIVVSEYDGTVGTPALFKSVIFAELANLHGDGGAKSIIAKYESDTVTVPFVKGGIDIDTTKDLMSIINLYQ